MNNSVVNILIINGVNLACLGTREVDVYGCVSFDKYLEILKQNNPQANISFYHSDCAGEIASKITSSKDLDAIILNAGAYTHSSIVLADAIKATNTPVIEVHISNLFGRENYRKNSLIASACTGFISGFGLQGYDLAIKSVIQNNIDKIKLFKI